MNFRQLFVIFIVLLLSCTSGFSSQGINNSVGKSHTGTVLESQKEGKYIYLKLDVDGKEVWIATTPEYLTVPVTKGDKVEYVGGIAMENFHSKAMNRTFEKILFIARIKALTKDSAVLPEDDYHKKMLETKVFALPPEKGEIKTPEDGKTISKIISQREKLKDKEVILRAKVMKVSKKILNRYWIMLQDGSGESSDETVIFLSVNKPKINDKVTVRGIVRTNIDLGAGYTYKVLIEDVSYLKK